MPAPNGDPNVNGRGYYDGLTGLSEWYEADPKPRLPEFITKEQADAALDALGIEFRNGAGIVSVEIGVHKVTVTRWLRDADRRLIGVEPCATEVPPTRGKVTEAVPE